MIGRAEGHSILKMLGLGLVRGGAFHAASKESSESELDLADLRYFLTMYILQI